MTLVGHKKPGSVQGMEAMASVGELDTPDGTVLQQSMGDLKQHIVRNNQQ